MLDTMKHEFHSRLRVEHGIISFKYMHLGMAHGIIPPTLPEYKFNFVVC
jgi:hypothetical protein